MNEVEYIVGLPSGVIIDIKPTMINYLKQKGIIFYDIKYRIYCYDDLNYDDVKLLVSNLRRVTLNKDKDKEKNNRFAHRVLDFMGTQKHIKSYSINADSGVSVIGSIIIVNDIKFDILPFFISKVDGDFIIRNCRLQNLRGCPKKVTGNFNVSGNELFDLSDGPDYVGGNYDCSDNVLITLAGSPDVVKGDFDCSQNLLQNLKGSPIKVWGAFNCSKNKYLITLEDAPISGHIISDIKNNIY